MAGPLASLKVLDFTTLLPGPFASMILADLGASVLRVEAPGRPDLVREMRQRAGSVSAAHATVNRSKRCISLDLKVPDSLQLVDQLLESHDILLEQFRPGVMQRLGLGYEQLQVEHPKLIYCSLTGYGQTGPYRDRAGHDINYLALSGLSETSRRKDSGPVHIHIAEQVREVEEIQEQFGGTPVEWLLENAPVNSRWCLIHATHMTQEETRNLAKSGAVVGLCPITEANLGDGIFDGSSLLSHGGRYGIGSDSNVRISLSEELRLLEYSQRFVLKERNVMTQNSGSVGMALYVDALMGGAQALNRKSGFIAPEYWADLLTLDSEALAFCGCSDGEILDRWIFAGDDSLVCDVWSAGRLMVSDGRHVKHNEIERRYRSVIQEFK